MRPPHHPAAPAFAHGSGPCAAFRSGRRTITRRRTPQDKPGRSARLRLEAHSPNSGWRCERGQRLSRSASSECRQQRANAHRRPFPRPSGCVEEESPSLRRRPCANLVDNVSRPAPAYASIRAASRTGCLRMWIEPLRFCRLRISSRIGCRSSGDGFVNSAAVAAASLPVAAHVAKPRLKRRHP